MNLLMRHGLGSGHMETLIQRREHSGSPAASAHARWQLLNTYSHQGSVNDAKVIVAEAESATSTGRRFHISVGLEAPTASSVLYCDWDGRDPSDGKGAGEQWSTKSTFDYFVYRVSTTRPPSLSLLPIRSCFLTDEEAGRTRRRPVDLRLLQSTGMLRRGEDELLVAELRLTSQSNERFKVRVESENTAELSMIRVGRSNEWEIKREIPIVHDKETIEDCVFMPWDFLPNRAVPVGDRFLCWVNYIHGFLLCDMAAEAGIKLRYVPLPVVPFTRGSGMGTLSDDRWIQERLKDSRDMCAAGDSGAVRLVSVDTRCCCGGPVHGWSNCSRSQFAFTVTTWTLSLSMDEPMTWVKEGVIDCEVLWALPGYKSLPHVIPENPVVSLDNPDVICFTIRLHDSYSDMNRKEWLIEYDTKTKALLSAVPTTDSLSM